MLIQLFKEFISFKYFTNIFINFRISHKILFHFLCLYSQQSNTQKGVNEMQKSNLEFNLGSIIKYNRK